MHLKLSFHLQKRYIVVFLIFVEIYVPGLYSKLQSLCVDHGDRFTYRELSLSKNRESCFSGILNRSLDIRMKQFKIKWSEYA